MKVLKFLKDWVLVVSMIAGIAGYFIFAALPFPAEVRHAALSCVEVVQPLLIFFMLFLTFCRLDLHDLRLCRWHKWLLLIQAGAFSGIALILIALPHSGLRVVLEGAMLCMICPTATASAVITRKLGGDVASITTYLILVNIAVAILIPSFVPFVHPHPGMGVISSGLLILGKVFPLLLLPLFAALAVKKWLPALHRRLRELQELSFYLWAVALALALTVTTRSIVHSDVSISTQVWLVVVSFICCIVQFKLGWIVGDKYGDHITAGQALGQKNTVFVIWLGYTFFSPVTSVVGGFYSIWHNVINSWQLYRHKQQLDNEQEQIEESGEGQKSVG